MSSSTADAPGVNAEVRDLALVAQTIFSGQSNFVPLSSGKPAIIKPSSMAQMPALLNFIRAVVEGMDQAALGDLLTRIITKQQEKIAQGQDPNQIDVTALDDLDGMTRKAFGNASLLMSLFVAVAEEMPPLVEACTNLSRAEYEQLQPDEGILIAAAIFVANYAFFIRSLPPILTGFVKSRASLPQATAPASTAKKTVTVKRSRK